jgi:hypothetical protein
MRTIVGGNLHGHISAHGCAVAMGTTIALIARSSIGLSSLKHLAPSVAPIALAGLGAG